MSIGYFIDKSNQPSENEIYSVIDKRADEWKKLVDFIHLNFSTQEEIKFLYGKTYGWALRFVWKGKLITALFPSENCFTVQVILNTGQLARAASFPLGEKTRNTIQQAHEYREGKWLFLKVEGEEDLPDIERLIELKAGRS